jgi:hypothetical protein
VSKHIDRLVNHIRAHRCYSHPIFKHWAEVRPKPEVIGAFFHHMEGLCTASRYSWDFEEGLAKLDMFEGKKILQDIVASEEDHGPHLATMAGFLMNRAAGRTICPDLLDQQGVENKLKECSQKFFSSLPGYDQHSGRTRQDRRISKVFERRTLTDSESTYRNIGTLLAVEMIAAGHVFPGEMHCLFETGLYGVTRANPEMQYLFEHAGSEGAENWHAQTAIQAAGAALNESTETLIREGADECLDAIADLWDLLDSTLLIPDYTSAAAAIA